MRRSILHIQQILDWADRHYELTGKWPETKSGRVREVFDEVWANIDASLNQGHRGLPRGGSLARLLAQYRGKRNGSDLPKYTIRQILQWADAHHAAHGKWPNHKSGPIASAPGETWCAVAIALHHGLRGLKGGNSLAKLLAAKRGVPHPLQKRRFSVAQILAWADAYRRRTGTWPTAASGSVEPAALESWLAIDRALKRGLRGLPGHQSLASLLAQHRGVHRHVRKRPLALDEILRWADAHHVRTRKWPDKHSGPISEAIGETWFQVDDALRTAKRGLPPGQSLARLLATHRGRRNIQELPNFSIPQILAWADAHRDRCRKWPTKASGRIAGVVGESWSAVNCALRVGSRGLPGGSSLAQLLAAKRGRLHKSQQPRLTVRQIIAWADAYHDRTGKWPTVKAGLVGPFSQKTWSQIDDALRSGYRGLPGGQSLFMLLADRQRASKN